MPTETGHPERVFASGAPGLEEQQCCLSGWSPEFQGPEIISAT